MKGALKAVGHWLWQPFSWLLAESVVAPDAPAPIDGLRTVAFFATVLTTQAAALVVIVQGNPSGLLLRNYLIYLLFAALPLIGLVAVVLRNTKPSDGDSSIYNQATISFGRWALVYGAILTLGLPFAGWLGWIPGQKTRTDFNEATISCRPVQVGLGAQSKELTNSGEQEWVRTQLRGLNPNETTNRKMLFIEQSSSFAADYRRFPAYLKFRKDIVAVDGDAYLVRRADSAEGVPLPRPQRLLPKERSDIQRHVVDLVDPNKGETLILFLVVRWRDEKRDDPMPTTPADYEFELRVK